MHLSKKTERLHMPPFIFWLIANHWRPRNYWSESGREEEGHGGGKLKYSSCARIWVDGSEQRQNKNEDLVLDAVC